MFMRFEKIANMHSQLWNHRPALVLYILSMKILVTLQLLYNLMGLQLLWQKVLSFDYLFMFCGTPLQKPQRDTQGQSCVEISLKHDQHSCKSSMYELIVILSWNSKIVFQIPPSSTIKIKRYHLNCCPVCVENPHSLNGFFWGWTIQ